MKKKVYIDRGGAKKAVSGGTAVAEAAVAGETGAAAERPAAKTATAPRTAKKTTATPSTLSADPHAFSVAAVAALAGLLVSRATVYGSLAPFGIGVAAAISGPGAVLVYLATIVGYLLPGGVDYTFRYVAAVAAVGAIRWALQSLEVLERRTLYPPFLATGATLITGIGLSITGGTSLYEILIILAESLLAGSFCWFFASALQAARNHTEGIPSMTILQQASVIVVLAIALVSAATLEINGISPGRAASVVVILVAARCGREKGGAIAGAVMGAAMSISAPEMTYISAAYAAGGLMAGLFSRFGRVVVVGAFLATDLLVVLGNAEDLSVLVGVYEAGAAGIAFMILPQTMEPRLGGLFAQGRDLPAAEGVRRLAIMQLNSASGALEEVTHTVEEVSRKLTTLTAPDPDALYTALADDFCGNCSMRLYCWDHARAETLTSFHALTPYLRQEGAIERGHIGGHLAQHCNRPDALVARINAGYSEHLIRESAWRRLNELRTVVADQFSVAGELLGEVADGFSEHPPLDMEAAMRVRAVCEEHGILVENVVCYTDRHDRMTVQILAGDEGVTLRENKWFREICAACGRTFGHPRSTRLGQTVRLTLSEKTKYLAELSASQICSNGEKLCGDAWESFVDEHGRMTVVLSDGMGCGGRAAVDGAMAAGLTARLLKAGMGADSTLRMVNAALMIKSEDESLATLDVVTVDLYSGRMESLKAGAALTLLRSKGRVSRIERASMPVGILREATFERSVDTLTEGDVLVMVSDGVVADGMAWLEELVRDFDMEKHSPQRLAEDITAEARRRRGDQRGDDCTALILRIVRNTVQSP